MEKPTYLKSEIAACVACGAVAFNIGAAFIPCIVLKINLVA